jgi:hypothetical protein
VTYFSETSVAFQNTTRRYIPARNCDLLSSLCVPLELRTLASSPRRGPPVPCTWQVEAATASTWQPGCCLSRTTRLQSTLFHIPFLGTNFVVSFHLCLGISSCFCPSSILPSVLHTLPILSSRDEGGQPCERNWTHCKSGYRQFTAVGAEILRRKSPAKFRPLHVRYRAQPVSAVYCENHADTACVQNAEFLQAESGRLAANVN